MKKTALTLALAALCSVSLSTHAAPEDPYLVDSKGDVVKNSTGLCWRTAGFAPENATAECDPDLVKKPAPPAPAPVKPQEPTKPQPAAPTPRPVVQPPAPMPAPAPAPVKKQKVVLSGDTYFDTNKSTLRISSRNVLDSLVAQIKGTASLVGVSVTGHTDSRGTDKLNQALSESRAKAVADYLADKGIDKKLITSQGKGKTEPIASNKTKEGRAKNRRVDVEISISTATPPAVTQFTDNIDTSDTDKQK